MDKMRAVLELNLKHVEVAMYVRDCQLRLLWTMVLVLVVSDGLRGNGR